MPTYNDFKNQTHTRPMLAIGVLAGALVLSPSLALAETSIELSGDAQISTEVEGAAVRDAAAVSTTAREAAGLLASCGAREGTAAHSVRLTVDATGAVTDIANVDSALDETYAGCINDKLKSLSFGPSAGVETIVFAFVVKGDAPAPAAEPAVLAPAAGAAATAGAAAVASEATAAPTTPTPAPEATPPAAEASAPAPTADATAPAAEGDAAAGKDKKKDKNALAQMAATGVPPSGDKPWSVNITLEGTLGAGAFTGSGPTVGPRADPTLAIDGSDGTTAFGYSVFVRGFWSFDPKLRAVVGFDFSQPLAESNSTIAAVSPNEFQFGEILFGALSPVFFTEENTGINLGGNFVFRLPTSKQAAASERILRMNTALNVFRTFADIGPGSLTTILSAGLRKDLGPSQVVLDQDEAASIVNSCRSFNKETQTDCYTNILPINWGLNYSASLIYTLLGNLNVSLGIGMQHAYTYYGGDSDTSGLAFQPGSSQNANDSVGQIDFLWGSLDVGYQWTSFFATRLGMITFQNPYVQSGNNSMAIANPLFDSFGNGAQNLTTYYLDFNFFL